MSDPDPIDDSEARKARMRDAFEEEALASLEEYRRTGLHLTWEEVKRWLATWGTEEDGPPPPCHR